MELLSGYDIWITGKHLDQLDNIHELNRIGVTSK